LASDRKYSLTRIRKWGEKGISSVEMAIVLPLLLFLVFGVVQFGLAWWVSQIITNGAREGARLGAVMRDPPLSETEIVTKVRSYLTASGFDGSQATVNVDYKMEEDSVSASDCSSGCEVAVSISVPITNLIPNLFALLPETLNAQAVMRHE
jgi:Flp pilus assembly protein TadG